MPQHPAFIRILGLISFTMLLIGCQEGGTLNSTPLVASTVPDIETASPAARITTPSQSDEPISTLDVEPQQNDIAEYSSDSKVEISFSGPNSKGLDPEINPFSLQVDVLVQSPNGKSTIYPAFYDGDGQGSLDGDVWKVRLRPYQEGIWHYEVRSQDKLLAGTNGSFEVVSNPECKPEYASEANLFCKGTLEYVGGHYLQFRDGEYWIKAGLDDPENILGTAFGDWEAKRAQIDLLSEMGVNSIYMITNNIDGDRKDTWPWVGDTEAQAKSNRDRFDVARLEAWEDFFSYAQRKGIVLHIVFNDDSAWRGYDEQLYIREMIARFAHHPGIIWNVGEEANEIFTDREQLAFAAKIHELDPYQHPVTVHRKSPWPFLGDREFDSTSIQVGDGGADFSTSRLMDYNLIVSEHRERSSQRGHPIPIMIDETPRITAVNPDVRQKFRTHVLYPIFLAGGNFELHFQDAYGQSGSVRIEDLEPLILDMVQLRNFLEELQFPEMEPCNQLLSEPDNICFGEVGKIYAVYLPYGGSEEVDLSSSEIVLEQTWFNPRTGEITEGGSIQGGQVRSFTAPDERDWVLLLDAR